MCFCILIHQNFLIQDVCVEFRKLRRAILFKVIKVTALIIDTLRMKTRMLSLWLQNIPNFVARQTEMPVTQETVTEKFECALGHVKWLPYSEQEKHIGLMLLTLFTSPYFAYVNPHHVP